MYNTTTTQNIMWMMGRFFFFLSCYLIQLIILFWLFLNDHPHHLHRCGNPRSRAPLISFRRRSQSSSGPQNNAGPAKQGSSSSTIWVFQSHCDTVGLVGCHKLSAGASRGHQKWSGFLDWLCVHPQQLWVRLPHLHLHLHIRNCIFSLCHISWCIHTQPLDWVFFFFPCAWVFLFLYSLKGFLYFAKSQGKKKQEQKKWWPLPSSTNLR